jgi:hypothetical protein
MDTNLLAIGERWGIPTLACLGFFYMMIKYVIPALARVTLDQIKTIAESNEKNTTIITNSSKENIQTIIESNERQQAKSQLEYKESLKQFAEMHQRNMDYNLQIHKLYADKIELMANRLDGVVTEFREFRDDISQRIEEVNINFKKS